MFHLVDFSRYEKIFCAGQGAFKWPEGDVVVLSEPRTERITTKPNLDLKGSPPECTTLEHLKEVKQFFEEGWLKVDWYAKSEGPRSKKYTPSVSPLDYEVDHYETPSDYTTEKTSYAPVTFQRNGIFGLMHLPESYRVPNFWRIPSNPPQDPFFFRFLMTAKSISWGGGMTIEPLFCTAFLYDFNEKKKVTETFSFHLNSSEQMQLVNPNGIEFAEKAPTRCIFHLPRAPQSEQLYLVINLSKIYKSENLDAHFELYTKQNLKNKSKLIAENMDSIKKLTPYRQVMAWGALPISSSNNQSLQIPITRTPKGDDLITYLDEVSKKTKLKSLGTVTLDLKLLQPDEELEGRLDPGLRPVHPFPEGTTDQIPEIQLLKDLPSKPIHTYINNIHVLIGQVQFPKTKTKFKDVIIEAKILPNDASPESPGLPLVYDPWNLGGFSTTGTTTVFPKKSRVNEEIKFLLPFQILSTHHIVFTMYSVDLKQGAKKSKEKDGLKSPIGYAFMPLYKNNCIATTKDYELPITTKLAPSYLTADPTSAGFDWIEKATLSIALNVISSVHPIDTTINQLLHAKENDVSNIKNLLEQLAYANVHEIVCFSPFIISTLVRLMCSDDEDFGELVWNAMHLVFEILSDLPEDILSPYLQYVFRLNENNNKFPGQFCKYWARNLKNNSVISKPQLVTRFYALLFRSLVLSLEADTLKDENTRSHRFTYETPHLTEFVQQMAVVVIEYISVTRAINIELGRFLNFCLAHFISDLFTIMDRGHVFDMVGRVIEGYGKVENKKIDKSEEMRLEMKLVFLRTIAQSPHYLALNCLEKQATKSFNNAQMIKQEYLREHFLATCIVNTVEECFASMNLNKVKMACNVLSSIMWWHDNDPRLTVGEDENVDIEAIYTMKSSIYFPYIITVAEHCGNDNFLKLNMDKDNWRAFYASIAFVLNGIDKNLLVTWWECETERRISSFFQTIKRMMNTFNYSGERPARALRSEDVAKYLDKERTSLPPLLLTTVDSYESEKSTGEKTDSTKKIFGKKRKKTTLALDDENIIFQNKKNENYLSKMSGVCRMFRVTIKHHDEEEVTLEKNFINEINIIVLETCITFINHFQPLLLQRMDIFEEIFMNIVKLLRRNKALNFQSKLLKTIHDLIPNFNTILWISKNTICSELIFELIRLCNSKVKSTRDETITLYISLLENNFKTTQNLARAKLQTTIGLTKFVGESMEEDNSYTGLMSAFSFVTKYYDNNSDVDSHGLPVSKQLQLLEEQIRNMIADNSKMRQFSYDPEMLSSLYYKISSQLLESPDERIAWLENLSNFHKDKGNHEEYAQTKIITAALVQEYLTLMNRWNAVTRLITLPSFPLVCPNFSEVLVMPDPKALEVLKTEICQSSLFNTAGFVKLLQEAIELLKTNGLLEMCVAIYQLTLPVLQETRDYTTQMSYYQELAELTRLLTDENYMKQRIFSNYYRVAFYGKILGDEDGKEYIYKEPNTTMLTVFTEKLMIQFKSKYGNDNVIKLGNTPMNSSESDPSKLYIQIGAVETSFTEQEVPSRSSEWLKNYNLSRFVMDQPFTKSGAAQGSHEDQWIRRTTFVIDKALPFVEKRSLVKSKEWCDISPIENAISLIQGKIESLSSELNTSQPRIKILQRDLQGSLLTQVNAGPLAIASSFLSEENQNKYDEKLRITLADGLNKFSRTLTVAVKVNKKYIDQDQAVLQEALESALEKFKAELDKYPIFEQLRQAFEQEQAKQREEAENKGNSTLAQMNPNTPRRQTKDVVRSPNIKSAAAFKMAQRSGSLAVRADSPIGTAKKSTFFGSQRQSPASHALATLPLSAQPLEEDDEEKAPAPATDPAEAKAEEKKPEEKPEKKEATEGAKGSFSASYGSILVPVLPQGLPVRSATAPASEEKVPVVVPQADGPTAEIEEKSESAQAKKED